MNTNVIALIGVVLLAAAVGALAALLWCRGHFERLLARQSQLDSLTGLPNRQSLLESVERHVSLAIRTRQPVSLLLVDIDHYGQMRKSLGQAVGDGVLQALAQRLNERVRVHDRVGRWDQDVFLLVLPDTDTGGALVVAEDLRQNLEQQHLGFKGREVPVTVSVGVHGRVPDVLGDAQALALAMTEAASRALAAAKQSGRNCTAVEP